MGSKAVVDRLPSLCYLAEIVEGPIVKVKRSSGALH